MAEIIYLWEQSVVTHAYAETLTFPVFIATLTPTQVWNLPISLMRSVYFSRLLLLHTISYTYQTSYAKYHMHELIYGICHARADNAAGSLER